MLDRCACRYEEDLALARDVGSNAFRFSLEWSKVEPQRGSIDKAAIQRYQQIIRCIRRSSSFLRASHAAWLSVPQLRMSKS